MSSANFSARIDVSSANFSAKSHFHPRDPDILKTVRVVNLLSVVNLLRVAIHYRKCVVDRYILY